MTPGRILRWLFVPVPLLLVSPTLRAMVESRMAAHMLGEFPALLAAGWSAASLVLHRLPARRWLRRQRTLDWHGWTTATVGSVVALVWMLPLALDTALLSPAVAVAKLGSWWLAGWLLADGWRRMAAEVRLFFAGNLAWMMATAGLLYIDLPARLCVNYLTGDQRYAGVGLVALAVALAALTVRSAVRPERQSSLPVALLPTAPRRVASRARS